MAEALYPWEEWMDGEVHEVREGVDYTCNRKSFVTYVRQKALSDGVEVFIENMTGRHVRFCFGSNFERQERRTFRWYKGEKVYD